MAWAAAIPAIIGAGAKILQGGIEANRGNSDNIDFQDAMAQRSYAQQKEFARYGIQWRAADALDAGIHPLAALGANMPQAQPYQIFPGGDRGKDYSWVGEAGQDLSRAVSAATDSLTQRLMQANVELAEERVKGEKIRNAQSEKDLNKASQAPTVFPSDGASSEYNDVMVDGMYDRFIGSQNLGTGYEADVQKIPTSNARGYTAGPPQAAETPYISSDGEIILAPSQNLSEPLESDNFSQSQQFLRKAWKALSRGFHGIVSKNFAREGSYAEKHMGESVEGLSKERERIMSGMSLGPDEELRYSPWTASWWVKKVRKRTGAIYYDSP